MRKLRIDIDSLQVDSFEVLPRAGRARGTVNAAGRIEPERDDTTTWGSGGSGSGNIYCISAYPCVPTNENTCQGTCNATCPYTCNAPDGVQCA